MSKETEIKVKCEIKNDDSLYLHKELMKGTINNKRFCLILPVSENCLIAQCDGKEVVVLLADLIEPLLREIVERDG